MSTSADTMGKILETLVSSTENLLEKCDPTNNINETTQFLKEFDDEDDDEDENHDFIIQESEITNQKLLETNNDISNTNNDTENEQNVLEEDEDFDKSNLSLNLDEVLPKNKKFLDSSEDLIINQFFSQTITITPTNDDDYNIDSTFLNNDITVIESNTNINNTTKIEPIDFFTQKVEEDDTTYTDTVDNYQENEANMCSLNDNFNENYCSFSSIDYQPVSENPNGTNNINSSSRQESELNNDNEILDEEYDNCLLTEHLKHQRPSIIIDCYDDDNEEIEKSDELKDTSENEHQNAQEEEQKINDYCFYFDQTIEEDDAEVNDIVFVDGTNVNVQLDEKEHEEIKVTEESREDSFVEVEVDVEEVEEEEEEEETTEIIEEEESGVSNESCMKVLSAIESFESTEQKVVKKTTKKVKKVTSKKVVTESRSSEIVDNGSIETTTTSSSTVEQQSQNCTSSETHQNQHQEEYNGNRELESKDEEQQKLKKKKVKKVKKSEKENLSVLNGIKIFNRLSMLSTTSIIPQSTLTTKAILRPGRGERGSHKKFINKSTSTNDLSISQKSDSFNCLTNSNHNYNYNDSNSNKTKDKQKKITISSNVQLHDDDLSWINVKHLRTKSFGDLRKLEQLPIHTGINVRNLRDSYCSLVGLNDSNAIKDSRHVKDKIKLGIKQFDMKSSFSKFDALQRKNSANVQNGISGNDGVNPNAEKHCHACSKVVFQMEQIKAEKKFWHKNCFRCSECSKQLSVDTYQSHEGVIFCHPHFKSLFAPKVVEDNNEPVRPRRPEMIIRENQPVELPPDVVRSSDKTDYGLEELQQLNVRSRFQVFENAGKEEKVELDRSPSGVKKSTSILSKLARFQAKGMDIGVVDDSLNGVCYEHSSDEESDEDVEEFDADGNPIDIELVRARKAAREKTIPMSFANMSDLKTRFETGQLSKEEKREERKQELQNIRSRLFMGKQAKIKEMYQQAVADSEQIITAAGKKKDIEISDKAKELKSKFEMGEAFNKEDEEAFKSLNPEELSVFEQGISKKSRSLFLELDATAAARGPALQQSPSSATVGLTRSTSRVNTYVPLSAENIVKCDSKMEDVKIETADICNKFKFFETYKPTEKEKKRFRITPPRDGVVKLPSPEREVYQDPDIARNQTESDEVLEMAEKNHTASKYLSMFRQMEEHRDETPRGPKPLKRFTPPPSESRVYSQNSDEEHDYTDDEEEYEDEEEEEEEEDEEQNPNYVKSSLKNEDEFIKAAISAERAKQLKNKFERWEQNEIKKEMNNSSVDLYDKNNDESQVESAKSLRARFELMRNESEPKIPATRIKVNRFV